ncbi:UAA transporter family-domain-containing protein [Crepidotus variabilis]|uniref:UAA transporter family-domain-containing protein n=1 Tax=Crepidotus variabilis TaxID=179855 RepID=A0A9P6ECS4_9AGAR|nr:UAA transporter family-domain-containing protein [Crepidotus variabilis]
MFLSSIAGWTTTISLIFGGCCSNALTLEQITLEHPNAGSVLTFFQFLLISLHGLPKFIIWTRFGPRFRPRRIPFVTYVAQVALFYFVNLLNNAAFAYQIPMAVHIIFRSAGLVITMLLGYFISRKRYNSSQVISVLLVTIGVVLTTLSAQTASKSSSDFDISKYAQGIGILTLALILSGFLGLLQDWTYSKYGRPDLKSRGSPAPWQESMFYLHFLALPMFFPLLSDLTTQIKRLNASEPRSEFSLPIPINLSTNTTSGDGLHDLLHPYTLPILSRSDSNHELLSIVKNPNVDASYPLSLSIAFPHIYIPLILNTVTQLVCVAGVHRLTTRVSALTVTLVLVVRKAASLIISVVGVEKVATAARDWSYVGLHRLSDASGWDLQFLDEPWIFNLGGRQIDVGGYLKTLGAAFVGTTAKAPRAIDMDMMWAGAAMVMLGTVGYTIGSSGKSKSTKKEKAE